MKHKVALIQPYFGALPGYFDLALRSYARNADFDWLLFTDDCTPRAYLPNVRVFPTTLAALKAKFQRHFNFPLSLERPYKLCDYKPLYGHLFAEHLEGYDFWGHYDPDVIFGRLNQFIPGELLARHDKIFDKGHFALYRNIPAVNLLYRDRVPECVDHRTVLSSPRNWAFDERVDGVNAFFAPRGLRVHTASPIANIYYGDYAFRLVGETWGRDSRAPQSCFACEDGGIYRHYLTADGIRREEFMYIHLQKRPMQVLCRNPDHYLIYGNAFREPVSITREFLATANRRKVFYRYFWQKRKFATNLRTSWRMLVIERDGRKFGRRLARKLRSLLGASGTPRFAP